jgi:hypothetical protein
MLYLAQRHGSGDVRSCWYVIDEFDVPKAMAVQIADDWARENPESDGWRAEVALFEDPNYPAYPESQPCYWARPKAWN